MKNTQKKIIKLLDFLAECKQDEEAFGETKESRLFGKWFFLVDNMYILLMRVSNELGDPIGERWGDNPDEDERLLLSLKDDIDTAMGWKGE